MRWSTHSSTSRHRPERPIASWPRRDESGSDLRGDLYVDTSGLGRILLREPHGNRVVEALHSFGWLVASSLLRVELMRLGSSSDLVVEALGLLGTVATLPTTDARLKAAETVEPRATATLDSIHLVTALELFEAEQVEAILTFDHQLAAAAQHHGLPVLSPG